MCPPTGVGANSVNTIIPEPEPAPDEEIANSTFISANFTDRIANGPSIPKEGRNASSLGVDQREGQSVPGTTQSVATSLDPSEYKGSTGLAKKRKVQTGVTIGGAKPGASKTSGVGLAI